MYDIDLPFALELYIKIKREKLPTKYFNFGSFYHGFLFTWETKLQR